MKNLLFTFLAFTSLSAVAAEFTLKVNYAPDGDTIRAFDRDGNEVKVRMLGVDTPEKNFKNQTQGEHALAATRYLRTLLPEGTEIKVVTGDEVVTEKWDRILGTVYLGDLNINKEILRQGYGMPYFIYPFDNQMINEYREACQEAQKYGRGVFDPNDPLEFEPYVFRMRAANQTGNNLVGDSASLEYFAPKEYKKVPVCNRVFFYNDRNAKNYGYRAGR